MPDDTNAAPPDDKGDPLDCLTPEERALVDAYDKLQIMGGFPEDEYAIIEALDTLQIIRHLTGDATASDYLFYIREKGGKPHLSYLGAKHLIKLMRKEMPIDIAEANVELFKAVEDDKKTWMWHGYCKCRNANNGNETDGTSSVHYINDLNQLAMYVAFCKAERDALVDQIPRSEIDEEAKRVDKDRIRVIGPLTQGKS